MHGLCMAFLFYSWLSVSSAKLATLIYLTSWLEHINVKGSFSHFWSFCLLFVKTLSRLLLCKLRRQCGAAQRPLKKMDDQQSPERGLALKPTRRSAACSWSLLALLAALALNGSQQNKHSLFTPVNISCRFVDENIKCTNFANKNKKNLTTSVTKKFCRADTHTFCSATENRLGSLVKMARLVFFTSPCGEWTFLNDLSRLLFYLEQQIPFATCHCSLFQIIAWIN